MKNTPTRAVFRLAAVAGGLAIITAGSAFPAAAADGDVQAINTETVQAYTDATGKVQSKRLYEQLNLTGDGTAELANPVETNGLRNLNGFSGFDVEDGEQKVEIDVDGEENIRSVSSYDEDLPLDIDVEYVLDGEPISPKSLVGKSGDLQVTYTVRNNTTQPQTIVYTDGKGGAMEETVEVMMPMVGSLSTELPENFREVDAEGASAAGNGKGGTRLSYTMTLLAPLGSDVAQLGYTAQVVDAVAPSASVTALPVNPLDNPTLSNAATSYKGGADTGEELAAGASQIDANLLKLRDGASDLLAGLIQLRNGADELSAGLQNEAAPGARQLADGAGELNDGLGDLDDGAGQLADGTQDLREGTGALRDGAGRLNDGAGQLADGTGKAEAGAKKLTGGLKQISEGLDTLAGTEGLGKAAKGITDLQAGMDEILQKVGTPEADGTLVGGLFDLVGVAPTPGDPTSGEGLLKAEAGAQQIAGGLQQLVGSAGPPPSGLIAAKGGVDQVKGGLEAATAVNGSLDQLIGGLTLVNNFSCANAAPIPDGALQGPLAALQGLPGPVQCTQLTNRLLSGANDSKTSLTQAVGGLGQVSDGLGTAITSLNTLLVPGAQALASGLTQAREGAAQLRDGSVELRAGLLLVDGGLTQLEVGMADAIDGVLRLAAGGDAAYAGGQELTSGLGELDAGAGQLADGTGDLVSGVGQLDAGANQLANGAGQLKGGTAKAEAGSLLIANGAAELASGLVDAADGSGLLAAGLGEAAQGAPQLVDGAQRLSDEGTKKLIAAGEQTAQDYGKQYALIMAGAERAQDGKMIVGAPEDSVGLAAYSFEIRGEDGEGGRNVARALGGLALLGAGAGLFALRRRFL